MNDSIIGIGNELPVIHIAIDVQTTYYNGLSEMRRRTFPARVIQASDRLRQAGVPTIWVAYTDDDDDHGMNWDFYSCRLTRPRGGIRPLSDTSHADLGLHKVHRDDLIYVKAETNAFHEPYLKEFINSLGCETVVYSGMNKCCCLAGSVSAAARHHYNTYVFLNLLADGSEYFHEGKGKGKMIFHQGLLYDCLSEDQIQNVKSLISRDYIKDLSARVNAKQALDKAKSIEDVCPTTFVRVSFRALRNQLKPEPST